MSSGSAKSETIHKHSQGNQRGQGQAHQAQAKQSRLRVVAVSEETQSAVDLL